MRNIDEIIIHCTATRENVPISVEQVRRWHVIENGWSDIGYHFLIGLDGVVHTGRPIKQAGPSGRRTGKQGGTAGLGD